MRAGSNRILVSALFPFYEHPIHDEDLLGLYTKSQHAKNDRSTRNIYADRVVVAQVIRPEVTKATTPAVIGNFERSDFGWGGIGSELSDSLGE
jgi:hypothetical protein